ncbi:MULTISPECIES: Hsp20/alpha crystallin family protein [unclassified Methylobacterium]|jgi:HSP20 family protein|uniref:Hsp20/alpha crystallin family protein n=1 Tax=unclassified Methylobacterium TaxID=2615210 RepID=UPI001353C569|nr:Hsp20/alpha crystallin family protein [Methylobacterium sp. 2A]MWV23302.1 Hsp20/alpha crystallin family protein [Methylobacterium sp. 2A]
MSVRDLIPWNRGTSAPAPAGLPNEPASPFLALHREVNRLFDDVFNGFGVPSLTGSGLASRSFGWPSVEVVEADGGALRVSAELPGLDEKDVELLIEDGVLTLKGEKRAETTDKERGYSERSYGRFERSIALPFAVQEDKAEATFRNGVLTVTLPRAAEAPERRRRIAINGSGASASKH